MDAVAELAVEAVGIEEGEEELEVLVFAVVRRGRHQQQVPGLRADALGEAVAAGFLQLVAEEVGGELVRFVEDDEVPGFGAELVLELLVARHLVEADDEVVEVLEGIAGRRGTFEFAGEHAELEAELLEEFVAPLLGQAAGGNDEDAAGIGAHDQLADVEPGHDGLSGARVVGEDEAERLAGQHRLVDRRDLMRQRVHVRGVDRHHGVEEEGEVDALGFDGELEGGPVAIEGPRAFGGGDGDRREVRFGEQAFPDGAVGKAVDERDDVLSHGQHRDHLDDAVGFDSGQGEAGAEFVGQHRALGSAYSPERQVLSYGSSCELPGELDSMSKRPLK